MSDKSVVTEEKLQEYHNNYVYPFLNGATHAGFTPVGTVISYFGETAPDNYLICDGTEYAKADYPQLADLLLNLTNHDAFVGSDDDHFKVPDLRGEFLRGTGTNSHENESSGARVGVHQNSTKSNYYFGIASNNEIQVAFSTEYGNANYPQPIEGETIQKRNKYFKISNASVQSANYDNVAYYSSRPTNTSVLYCIAYKNIYVDAVIGNANTEVDNPTDGQILMYDAAKEKWVNGGHKYDTEEHIVGTWIDGKPIYEKTIEGNLPSSAGTTLNNNIDISTLDIDTFISLEGQAFVTNDNSVVRNINFYQSSTLYILSDYTKGYIRQAVPSTYVSKSQIITIQYTKTTD